MPSMFSRKRGSSVQRPPLDQTTTSNAALAASQAFLQRQPSSGSLSSAAAAAALRSHTTSPEPVGNIQTKRMIRRGSITSVGSGSFVGTTRDSFVGSNSFAGTTRGSFVGSVRPGLQRRDSSSSMTERTFRTPSPGRSNGTPLANPNAPPVPAIPKNIPIPHKRSSSLDPPTRVMSPNQQAGGRAMSLDRKSMPPKPHGRPMKRLSDVHEEVERTDSNTSVNFSRPRASQPSSPVSPTAASQYTHGTGNWFSEPNVAPVRSQQAVNATALEQKIARIQAAAGQPVRTDHSIGSAQGTFLGRSNQQAPMPPDEMETVMVYDSSSRTFVPQLKPKPKATEPPSPTLPRAPAPAPGTYDPNTRRIVPVSEPKTLMSSAPALGTAISQQQRPHRPTLDTEIEPPPRNPARLSPINASSPGRQLHKQPSVVREEREEEDGSTGGSDSVDSGRYISTSVGPAKAFVVPDAPKQRSNSLDVPLGTLESAARARGGSTSPSPHRSARFSATPVMPATIHDPPARDVSPAKPALKHHSPASSVRTSSPMANFSSVPKSPVSETSETASQASQDAFSTKKKKSVRVSFDEQPHPIEASTAASTPTAINSSVLDDIDDEEMMKPRPALPSFGSVRKQRTPAVAEKVTEMAPERHESSNDHAIGGILRNANEAEAHAEPVPAEEVKGKQSAGYISDESSEDISSPLATSTPAKPPNASGVEVESSSTDPKVRDFAPVPEPSNADTTDVPAINLLPPTPGIEVEGGVLGVEGGQPPRTRASWEINLPGGWDKEEERQGATVSDVASQLEGDVALEVPDEEEPIIYGSPASKSPILAAIDEDSDNDSAEFSDAAEDLSELENGGYASLNAIAVSPVAKPSPAEKSPAATVSPTPPESPSVQQASKKADRPTSDSANGSGDWSQATAYWSKLSRQQREQIEREHLSSDDEARPPPAAVRKMKKKATTKPVVHESAARATPVAAAQTSVQATRAAPPAQTTMKKSMRAQPVASPVEDEPHMRQSMRTGNTTKLSSTLRNGPPQTQQRAPERKGGFAQKTMRPASSDSLSASAAGTATLQNRASTMTTQESAYPRIQPKPKPQSAPVMTGRPQKEFTNDSDSESSFKKKRRSSATDAHGRYSMKRSMRGGPSQDALPAREERPVSPTPAREKGRDSFSIRSLSPTGSLFGRKKQAENVRQSLRGSSVDAGPRMMLRNGPPNKGNARATRATPARSKFKSRFAADSDDDDDDPRPSRGLFRSRFADSDDEDDETFIAADLTPVRGIPKRHGQNDGDSTDLEDEDDDPRKTLRQREKTSKPLVPDPADVDRAMEAARKKLGMTDRPQQPDTTNQGTSLQRGSLRNSTQSGPKPKADDSTDMALEKKKRGFMGSILRRNRGSTASVPQVNSPLRNQHDVPPSPAVDTAVTQPTQMTARPQSPVSPPGKLIRRSSGQQPPRFKRGDSNYSNATAPPAVGESDLGGDWPLPAVPRIPEQYDGRPNTSDGSPAKAGRAGSVRFEDTPEAYSQRTGRKKKFGKLRRAFGLND